MEISYQDKIKRYINQRGITQKEFAKRCGLSMYQIANIVTGRGKVLPHHIEKLDALFNHDFNTVK